MSDSSLRIAVEPEPHDAALKVLDEGLDAYNLEQAGDYRYSEFVVGVRDDKNELVGGVLGCCFWDALFIKYVWLKREARLRGTGTRMLALAEQEGAKRGCKVSYLDTFSFQAPGFYKKLGYEMFGTLDFPDERIKRHWLKKDL